MRSTDGQWGINCAPHAENELHRPLPISTLPYPGESLASLLLRIAELNGLQGASALLRAAGIVAYGPLMTHEINALARLCRLSPNAIHHMCPVEIGGYGRGEVAGHAVYGNRLPSGHLIVRDRERVCPLCIRQHGYLFAEHGLTLMTACPIHHVRLIERCGSCRTSIRPSRTQLATCRCGVSFTAMQTVAGMPEEDFLAGLLHAYWCRSASSTTESYASTVYRMPGISTLADALTHLMRLWSEPGKGDMHKASIDDIRCQTIQMVRRLLDALDVPSREHFI